MNYEKSKVLLKKINALHEAMSHGEGSNSLERDLFLQYIRALYEIVNVSDSSQAPAKEQISIPTPIMTPQKPMAETDKANENKVSTPKPQNPPEEVLEVLPNTKEQNEIPDEIQALYDESDESFDSSRILGVKITDIGRSMGINEKILTINELFDGQQPLFDETIGLLNKADNFEEAKKILASGVAQEKEWANANRRGKAIHFIHLVRRKYSN